MKMCKRLCALLAIACFAAGCGSGEVEETVWDDQIETMDKAREVEQKLMDRAGRLSDELETDDKQKDPPD